MAKKRKSYYTKNEVTANGISFAAKEAYNLLRTNLFFSFSDDAKCHVIGVTSTIPSEGKSLTAANTAMAMAEAGKRVLLIDSDMRLPTIHKKLGFKAAPGLSNLLVGMNDVEKAIYRLEDKGFDVMPAGNTPPNPTELLGSARMEKLLNGLSAHYDYIIIDLPPVTIVSDALVCSKYLSGIVFVVRGGRATTAELGEAIRQLEFANVKILGFVYNSAEGSKSNSYSKKYSKNYSRYSK